MTKYILIPLVFFLTACSHSTSYHVDGSPAVESTPVATPTPGQATPTPSPTPQPTATATPTPTPTPVPTPVQVTLTVSNPSGGTFSVASGTKYDVNSSVQVTVTPPTGYSFQNWTGACSGYDTCSIVMSSDKTVGAQFVKTTQACSVANSTGGNQTWNATTHQYDSCVPASCLAHYNLVNNTCAAQSYTLTVTKPLNSAIISDDTVQTCGLTCTSAQFTYTYPATAILHLTSKSIDYNFTGWTGNCVSTANDCSVGVISANETVTANFTQVSPLSLTNVPDDLLISSSYTFTATGGNTPYVWSVTGPGSIDASTGKYTADASDGSTAVIKATDKDGRTATASLVLHSAPLISGNSSNTYEAPASVRLSVTGGEGPYTWSGTNGATFYTTTGTVNFVSTPNTGAVVVKVTDKHLRVGTLTLTYTSPLVVTPSSFTNGLVSGTIQMFNVTGGTGPYTWTAHDGGQVTPNSNGSSVNYAVPSGVTSSSIDVKDSVIGSRTIYFQIFTPLSVATSTPTQLANSTATYSVSGGKGPFTWTVVSGSGTINSTTGAFTAGTTSGTSSIQATDSNGRTITIAVQVVTSPVIALTPNRQIDTNQSGALTVTGGTSPYSWVVTSGATLTSTQGDTNSVTSTTVGSYTVTVTDKNGTSSTKLVTFVLPLAISPSNIATTGVTANATQTLSVTGGVSPYAWSVSPSGQTGTGASFNFVAPSSAGVSTITVTDARGVTSVVNIPVYSTLTIAEPPNHFLVGSTYTFSASGGTGIYTWSARKGTIDQTGKWTADLNGPDETITLTDSSSRSVSVPFLVVKKPVVTYASGKVLDVGQTASLAITDGTGTGTINWQVSGGAKLNSTIGTSNTLTSLYSGIFSVLVTDVYGYQGTVSITYVDKMAITPSVFVTGVVSGSSTTLKVSGGVGPFSWLTSNTNGTLTPSVGTTDNSSEVFTAPTSAQASTITVTDSRGSTAQISINSFTALAITNPAQAQLSGTTYTYTASGGLAPYAWSLQAGSVGTINATTGVYTAGTTAGSATILVTDSNMRVTTSTTQVVTPPTLAISPTRTLDTNEVANLTITGGTAPFSWSASGSGATFGTASPTNTLTNTFKNSYSGTFTVTVTDKYGYTATKSVQVIDPLQLLPNSFAADGLVTGTTQTFTIGGGQPPYVWSSDLNATLTSPNQNVEYYVVPSGTTDKLKVTDARGVVASVTIPIFAPLTITNPITTIGVNQNVTFTATGGKQPYSWATQGYGTINATSGAFSAGTVDTNSTNIVLTDANGRTVQMNFAIIAAPVIYQTNGQYPLDSTQVANFGAFRGQMPFTWTVSSGATISIPASVTDTSARNVSTTTPGTYTVTVTDTLGLSSSVSITFITPVQIAPTVIPNGLISGETYIFSASGGTDSGYNWQCSVTCGGVSIYPATYKSASITAPSVASPTLVTITVSDTRQQTSSMTVMVYPKFSIANPITTLDTSHTYTFQGQGGSGNYTWSMGSGGVGSINSSTGLFTPGSVAGDALVILKDDIGHTTSITVAVYLPLQQTGSGKVLYGSTTTATGTNGRPGYTWSVSGPGNIDTTSGASVIITPTASSGTITVLLTDSINNTSSIDYVISTPVTISSTSIPLEYAYQVSNPNMLTTVTAATSSPNTSNILTPGTVNPAAATILSTASTLSTTSKMSPVGSGSTLASDSGATNTVTLNLSGPVTSCTTTGFTPTCSSGGTTVTFATSVLKTVDAIFPSVNNTLSIFFNGSTTAATVGYKTIKYQQITNGFSDSPPYGDLPNSSPDLKERNSTASVNGKFYFNRYSNAGSNQELVEYNPATSPPSLKTIITSTPAVTMVGFSNSLYFTTGVGTVYKLDSSGNVSQLAPTSFVVYSMIEYNGLLYMNAKNGTLSKLYTYNPSTNTILLASNIASNDTSSFYYSMTLFNNELYFTGYNGSGSSAYLKLFKVGLDGKIKQVSNIAGLYGHDAPNNMTSAIGNLYFAANNSSGYTKMYKLDSSGNITQVVDILGASKSDTYGPMVEYNGKLFFLGWNVSNSYKLYSIDSNDVVTRESSLNNGSILYGSDLAGGVSFESLKVYNGDLYMNGFLTNGTTKIVKMNSSGKFSIALDVNSSDDQSRMLGVFNNQLWFAATPLGYRPARLYNLSTY